MTGRDYCNLSWLESIHPSGCTGEDLPSNRYPDMEDLLRYEKAGWVERFGAEPIWRLTAVGSRLLEDERCSDRPLTEA